MRSAACAKQLNDTDESKSSAGTDARFCSTKRPRRTEQRADGREHRRTRLALELTPATAPRAHGRQQRRIVVARRSSRLGKRTSSLHARAGERVLWPQASPTGRSTRVIRPSSGTMGKPATECTAHRATSSERPFAPRPPVRNDPAPEAPAIFVTLARQRVLALGGGTAQRRPITTPARRAGWRRRASWARSVPGPDTTRALAQWAFRRRAAHDRSCAPTCRPSRTCR